VSEVLSSLRLENHPGKTFIGKIERGFDFLGYRSARAFSSWLRKRLSVS
jgi:hypothetical protein